jgi:hypothetical protein
MFPFNLRVHIRVEIEQTELVSECANQCCKTAIIEPMEEECLYNKDKHSECYNGQA